MTTPEQQFSATSKIPGRVLGSSNEGASSVSSAASGSTTSRLGSFRAASSGSCRQNVRAVRSGLMTRSTKKPSLAPCRSVSRISFRRSILGRWGNWAKAPTRSFTRRLVSPSRHRSNGPSGKRASALTAVCEMRERASRTICGNRASPGFTVSLNAWASFFSDTVTTMPYSCRIDSGMALRLASRLAASFCCRSGSMSWPLSWCCTSSQPR
jgi:hypothetical protein